MSPLRFPEIATSPALNRAITTIARKASDSPSFLVNGTLIALVNGVDVYQYLGGQSGAGNPQIASLGLPLFAGNYNISIVQSITESGVNYFYGDNWDANANYNGIVPLKYQPYRQRDGAFVNAKDRLNKMDVMWSEHEDSDVIESMLEAYREQAFDFIGNMLQVRRRLYVKYAEGVDRRRIANVTLNGAIGQQVPYLDIPFLFDAPNNESTKYTYGKDFFINSNGIPVFVSDRCPGRAAGASARIISSTFPAIPTESPSSKISGVFRFATPSLTAAREWAVFSSNSEYLTGFDFFVQPPQVPGASVANGSDRIGLIYYILPGTADRKILYDPSINQQKFYIHIDFAEKISLRPGEFIIFGEDRSSLGISGDVDPEIKFNVWLNKNVDLFGPDYHIKSDGLAGIWGQIAKGKFNASTLSDKVKLGAFLFARTDRSLLAIETLVEASLDLPVSPFDGFVDSIVQPDPNGLFQGQIDISGGIQEFVRPIEFSVSPGDRVSYLQRLVSNTEKTTIDDFTTDPTFLNGSDADPYLASKIVSTPSIPIQFVIPGAEPFDYPRMMLKNTSFRISLGSYASQRFAEDPVLAANLFVIIDSIKPSGTDYWIRLTDGTGHVRGSSTTSILDVSSKLTLGTDYANRIYNLDGIDKFATSQYPAAKVFIDGSGSVKTGDQFDLNISFINPLTSLPDSEIFTTQVQAGDFSANPIHVEDEFIKRLVALFNSGAGYVSTRFTAEFIGNLGNRRNKIQFVPKKFAADAGDIDLLKRLSATTFYISHSFGIGNLGIFPILASPGDFTPFDPSMIFFSQDEAVEVMNSYLESPITIVGDPTNTDNIVSDNGPFDDTYYEITPGTTFSFEIDPFKITDPRAYGRLSLTGTMALHLDETTSTAYLSKVNANGAFAAGDSFEFTVTSPLISGGPLTITRVMLASDLTPSTCLAGLMGDINKHIILSQFLLADYTTVGGFMFSIKSKNLFDGHLFTITLAVSAGSLGTGATLNVNGTIGQTVTPPTLPSVRNIVFRPIFLINGNPFYPVAADHTTPIPELFPDDAGGHSFFESRLSACRQIIPTGAPIAITGTVTVSAPGVPGTISPKLRIYEMKLVANNYPEFSRDDDLFSIDEVMDSNGDPGSFSQPSAPCRDAIPASPLIPISSTEVFLDLTSRLVAPISVVKSSASVDYGESEVYGVGASPIVPGAYTISQNVCSVGIQTVSYLPGSSRLYFYRPSTNAYTPMVLGVDYTEGAGPTPSTISSLVSRPAGDIIVGFVRATDPLRYYDGPRGKSFSTSREVFSAYGLRALYPEAAAPGSDNFRQQNGVPIPYDVNAYKNSTVYGSRAFSLDDDVFTFTDKIVVTRGI